MNDRFETSEFKVPEINVPVFKVPEINVPEFKVSNINVPEFKVGAKSVFGIEVEKVISDGYPTKVVKVYLTNESHEKRAVKLITRSESAECRAATIYFHNEVTILRHKHIMTMVGAGTFPKYHCMVMPYYEVGTLTKMLMYMDQGLIDHYFVQLCSALKYIHERNLVHRDIKTDNILITNKNDIVLADFGLSDILRPGESKVKGRRGTVVFMAPEQYTEPSYDGFKADMYSLGIVLWCMIFGQDVLADRPGCPLLNYVTFSQALTRQDKLILTGLLDDQPTRRWNIHQLIDSLSEPGRFISRIEKLREDGLL